MENILESTPWKMFKIYVVENIALSQKYKWVKAHKYIHINYIISS